MRYLFLLLNFLIVPAFATKYSNCEFQNTHYKDVCSQVVKNGVSYDYANKFLLSYHKTQKLDDKSWRYLHPEPKKIKKAAKAEPQKKVLSYEQKSNLKLAKRVSEMIKNLNKHKAAYDFAEEQYNVNREIISAILMKETQLGQVKPSHDAFIVFNTILTKLPKAKNRRDKWLIKLAKTNMATVIKFCYDKKLKPRECNLPSSYAGAIGYAQFMPNSLKYAKGFKDDTPDLTDMDDAIVSIANFLNQTANFNEMIEWNKIKNVPQIENNWYTYSLNNKHPSFVYEESSSGRCYQCFSKGRPELEYMKEYMKKVMRYNNSSDYAIGVMRLAYDAQQILQQTLITQKD